MAAAADTKLRTLEDMRFDNTFVRELPGDKETSNSLRQVEDALYSLVQPTPTGSEPTTVAYSRDVAGLLDVDPAECERPEFAMVMSGAAPLPGSQSYAQCYGGHQFGSWAGQLGDGRAITLGEVVNSQGQRWELQLKGAGKTPYSRRADGRAVMRSSIREYVASEAMEALGVPTTRALCCISTGDGVYRDMFYNGNVKIEPGAVVCRVAPSFVRFGTFQLPVSRGGMQVGLVKLVADYVIRHHYPHLMEVPEGSARYAAWLREVVERTGRLAGLWQGLGFVHGVLNTDNMSILGLTIDYGPYGFMDSFDPGFTPNMTDFQGRRYCYSNQPQAVQWNCVQLANALFSADLVEKEEAEAALARYAEELYSTYNGKMAAKLGLQSHDQTLTTELLTLMAGSEADWTNTFRALAHIPTADSSSSSSSSSSAANNNGSSSSSLAAADQEQDEPNLPPLASPEAAVAAAVAAGLPQRLIDALSAEQLQQQPQLIEGWAAWLRVWKGRLAEEGLPEGQRMAMQAAASPKFVPRQHLLQYAIEAAEAGDYSELDRLMQVLERPYDEQPEADAKYSSKPPPEMVRPGVCVLSCSS
ncbi:hypothetical protein OEZ86_009071 [Tetradesmus obliquus]|nr:hypothetical protein OEZ86_009071 [Tetradesmus obliquus]